MGTNPSMMPQATHSEQVEQLSQGVTREWLCDGQIVVYAVLDVRRESIDTWVDAFTTDLMNWPADQPFRVIHDFSAPGAVTTPYARARAQEIVDVRPEIKGRAAVVLSASVFNSLIHLFLNRQSNSTPRVRKTFMSREAAIAWLLSED